MIKIEILVNDKIIKSRLLKHNGFAINLACQYNPDIAHLHINNTVDLLFIFNNQSMKEKASVSYIRLDHPIKIGFKLLNNNKELQSLLEELKYE